MDILAANLGANMAIDELTESGQIGSVDIDKDVIMPAEKIEVRFNEDMEMNAAFLPNVDFSKLATLPIKGESLTVIFDGVKYICTAFPMGDSEGLAWGNLGFAGGVDSGEPFLVVADNSGAVVVLCHAEGIYTVELCTETETLKTIDPKYLDGVCLPYIELHPIANEQRGMVLPKEESDKLYEYSEKRTPIIVCVDAGSIQVGVANLSVDELSREYNFNMISSGMLIELTLQGYFDDEPDLWSFEAMGYTLTPAG